MSIKYVRYEFLYCNSISQCQLMRYELLKRENKLFSTIRKLSSYASRSLI